MKTALPFLSSQFSAEMTRGLFTAEKINFPDKLSTQSF
jgi:hypothetical protein